MKFLVHLILILSLSAALAACGDSSTEAKGQGEGQGQGDTEEGTLTQSGLRYIEIEPGDGAQPQVGSTVFVHYVGKLENGTQFDNSYDRGKPIDFRLGWGQMIAGWDEGIALMRQGGKARLIVPPHLGYGQRAKGPIPPNSTLIFEVELVEVR